MSVDVNKVLDQLAKGFNVAVDELYPILYKQAIIDGIISLVWAVFFITVITGFIFAIRQVFKQQKSAIEKYRTDRIDYREGTAYDYPRQDSSWDWDEPRQVTLLCVGAFFTIIGAFVIPIGIETAITALANTEYYMIKDILGQLNGGG